MGLVTFRGGQLATTPPFRGLNEWSTARAGSAISSHVQQPELVDARPRAETSSEGLPGRLFELFSTRAVTREYGAESHCRPVASIDMRSVERVRFLSPGGAGGAIGVASGVPLSERNRSSPLPRRAKAGARAAVSCKLSA